MKFPSFFSRRSWGKYLFEFVLILVAVIAGFALNNWNENRKDQNAETKILTEIYNGLEQDLKDIKENSFGHKAGIKACKSWRKVIQGTKIRADSLNHIYHYVARDFVSIQNRSGYESLKSKGLEIIRDDELRFAIISLYEYDFNVLQKLEENYGEMQFHNSFFEKINGLISPGLIFNKRGDIIGIDPEFRLEGPDKNLFMSYLWKIQTNRQFILMYYYNMEKKIEEVREKIAAALPAGG